MCAFGTQLTCRPFLWRDGHMMALPTLGGNNGQASAINNRGQIVGISETTVQDSGCSPSKAWKDDIAGIVGKRRSPSSSYAGWRPRRLRTRHQRSRPGRRLLGNLHQHCDSRRIVGKRHCLPASGPRTRLELTPTPLMTTAKLLGMSRPLTAQPSLPLFGRTAHARSHKPRHSAGRWCRLCHRHQQPGPGGGKHLQLHGLVPWLHLAGQCDDRPEHAHSREIPTSS